MVQKNNERVGPRTSRDRLLQLLKQSIRRKKRRSSNTPLAVKTNPGPSIQQDKPVDVEESENEEETPVQTQEPDFVHFKDSDLSQMLREVGLDTGGWGRKELIESCEIHKDLSE